MPDLISYHEEKLVENEMVFREVNESVQKNFDKLIEIAKEDNQESLVQYSDDPMHYYCECADENCHERIIIAPSEYSSIHENRKRFVISKNHEVPSIEKVVIKKPDYFVVEKNNILSEKQPMSLNPTDVDNS